MEIPQELINDFINGDVVLFVGAGMSINAGLPGWIELAKPLSNAIGYSWPKDDKDVTTDHLLTTMQYYENINGRNALLQYLFKSLDTTNKYSSEIHLLITKLPTKTIFTTNYDDLLERTYRDAGQRTSIIVDNIEIAFSKENVVKIVKLCGDLARPESIILTKKDFNIFFETRRGILDKLRIELESKTMLFLGYALRDPFINQLWDSINFTYGKYQRRGFCVMFDVDSLESDDLARRNMNVIKLSSINKNKGAVLKDWLEELLGKL